MVESVSCTAQASEDLEVLCVQAWDIEVSTNQKRRLAPRPDILGRHDGIFDLTSSSLSPIQHSMQSMAPGR